MKEKFEHKLINKINEVFDSHQTEYNPQDWENLKEKLPAKKSRVVPIFWNVVKVAGIIIFVAVGSYVLRDSFTFKQNQNSEVINNIPADTINKQTENKIFVANSTDNNISEQLAEQPRYDKSAFLENDTLENEYQIQEEYNEEMLVTDLNTSSVQNILDLQELDSISSESSDTKDIIVESNLQKGDTVIVREPIVTPVIVPAEDYSDINDNKKHKQKVRFGLEVASFTNYSPENVAPNLNYGGGVTAAIPIIKRFSFNPGLIVSVYNMEFSNNQNIIDNTNPTYLQSDNFIENNPEARPTEINLTGLDIPINFQYQFIKRKSSDYFIELGFSSLIYLSERYQYDFVVSSGGIFPNSGSMPTESVSENIDAFKTFDFAKLINFSIGWDYRLSKRMDFTLNPYIKYPVSNLTSGDFKFGSGGLKIKFMIKPKK